MEQGFEKTLHSYRDAIKEDGYSGLESDEAMEGDKDESVALLSERVEKLIKKVVRKDLKQKQSESRRVDEERIDQLSDGFIVKKTVAHRDIYAIQEEKQRIMDELKESIRSLDVPEKHETVQSTGAKVKMEGGELTALSDSGEWVTITEGDLFTDGAWGKFYDVNDESIPRAIRKQYFVEQAKQRLRSLLNEQILLDATSNTFEFAHNRAYAALYKERHEIPQFGHIIETMYVNALKKKQFDYNIGLRVEAGDVTDDVVRKVDAYLMRLDYARGVNLQQDDQVESLAVQMTINTDFEVLQKKTRQLNTVRPQLRKEGVVDDIILLKLGREISQAMGVAYDQWKALGRPSGGPDKLLPVEIQEKLFKNSLQKLYSDEELEVYWEAIAEAEEARANS